MKEIIEFRKTHNLTQTQFGELIGVNKQMVSSWERGRHKPTQQYLDRILQILMLHTEVSEEVDDIIKKGKSEGKTSVDILMEIKKKGLIAPYNESLIYRKVLKLK